MSYPQNGPEGGASPDHRYPQAYPAQPSYQPSQPSYPPQQPTYPAQPDYRPDRASGTAAVGSSSVYTPTRQMPAGAAGSYGSPMSGPPSGPPYDPALPGPQPPARRGRGIPVLAALAVLLLLIGGVMTALYVSKNGQLSDAKQDVATREGEIKDLQGQLQKSKDDLAKARQDLTGTQNAQKETQRQKQVISKCLNLLAELGRAAARNDQTAYNKAAKDVDKACNEAEKYLD